MRERKQSEGTSNKIGIKVDRFLGVTEKNNNTGKDNATATASGNEVEVIPNAASVNSQDKAKT